MADLHMQRVLLWERRNNLVPPFGETVQQVFARISALRDSLDGPSVRCRELFRTPFQFKPVQVFDCLGVVPHASR